MSLLQHSLGQKEEGILALDVLAIKDDFVGQAAAHPETVPAGPCPHSRPRPARLPGGPHGLEARQGDLGRWCESRLGLSQG